MGPSTHAIRSQTAAIAAMTSRGSILSSFFSSVLIAGHLASTEGLEGPGDEDDEGECRPGVDE